MHGTLPAAYQPWTDELGARALELWGQGHSAGTIAAVVGKVLGKVYRLGGAFKRDHRATVAVRPLHKANAPAFTAPWAQPVLRCWMDRRPIVALVEEAVPASAVPLLVELADTGCRWPFGSGRSTLFCGSDADSGRPYCAEHCRRAYG